jgi:hypothetical protein
MHANLDKVESINIEPREYINHDKIIDLSAKELVKFHITNKKIPTSNIIDPRGMLNTSTRTR